MFITDEMNATLIAPFTYTDIYKSVFSLGMYKAPGPDGFNGLFYQKNWEILKEDIWVIYFMGHFSNFFGYFYILLPDDFNGLFYHKN